MARRGGPLGGIVTGKHLKGMLLTSLAGGGGIMLVGLGTRQIPVAAPWKAAIGVGAGLLLGRALWGVSEDAAKGLMGGVVGLGLATLVSAISNGAISVGLADYDRSYGWAMGQPGTKYMNWGVGHGMGRSRVEEGRAGQPALGRTRVEERGEGKFMLGQNVNVGAFLT